MTTAANTGTTVAWRGGAITILTITAACAITAAIDGPYANLASDLVSKLTFARSVQDAATACQEWNSHHLETIAEDGKHLVSDV